MQHYIEQYGNGPRHYRNGLALAAPEPVSERLGEERLGPPSESIKAQLHSVTDLSRLKRMVRRAAKAVSWQEILDAP